MTDIAIIGASGYGGGELIRWLLRHPAVRLRSVLSETYAGQHVSTAFPSLSGYSDLKFDSGDDLHKAAQCPIVFLAGESGFAMCEAPALLKAGCKVIDLSADFRFRSAAAFESWYGIPHGSSSLCPSAIYGLPELHKEEISDATLIGNPGCYSTGAILALAPLMKSGLIDLNSVVIDGKSGISGAGRSKADAAYRFSEANDSVSAYKVAGTHRHTGEIEQELSAIGGEEITVSFTPHLVPMTRGILVSCYASLSTSVSATQVEHVLKSFYDQCSFVALRSEPPATKHTSGSNMVHIHVTVDPRTKRVSVFAALDNLGKGMAGQATQNMNLMLGLDETTGLEVAPLWP